MKHKPFQQGQLDGFCGAYCIVNAIHFLCGPLDEERASKIFNRSMRYLDRRKPIIKRINDGTRVGEITFLLDTIKKHYPIHVEKPFPPNKKVSLQDYWQQTQAFLSNHKGIVLLGINGFHDHWTLAKAITPKTLMLYDSDGIKRLSRCHCTTDERVPRRHTIPTSHTYYIWTDSDEGGQS